MSGVDGVMIGRGAMANPWIFRQIKDLREGRPVFEPAPADKRDLLLQYIDMLLEFMPEHQASGKVKQLIGQFFIGLPGSAQLRRDVQHARSIAEQRELIERYFEPFVLGNIPAAATSETAEVMAGALVES